MTVETADKVHGQNIVGSLVHGLASDVEDYKLTLNIFRDILDEEALSRCPVVQFDGLEIDSNVDCVQDDFASVLKAVDVDLNETVDGGIFGDVEDPRQQSQSVMPG